MKSRYYFSSILVSALLLSGCNDPKEASTGNFQKAAQQYLDSTYPSCYLSANFPLKTDGVSFDHTPEILHLLSQKGLLTEKILSKKHYNASFMSKERDVITAEYDLTDKGKEFYKSDANKNLEGNSLGGFCFGKAEVSEVSNFTEPSDAMGQKISRVSYSYKVSDIPDWAKSADLLGFSSKLKQDVDSQNTPIKRTDTFILTHNGWVHSRLFGK